MNFETEHRPDRPGTTLPAHMLTHPGHDYVGVSGLAGLGDSQGMPSATSMTMPSMVDTAQAVIGPTGSGIQPYNLVRYMPSIVNTEPTVVPQRAEGCEGVDGWLNQNPILAGLILAGAAYMLLGRKARA